ncbi:PQQ-binding-like beta-propeller repeat protein [Akkermansiaceae bacterium]|nr:PQQ-binding-like beta-propeller repeat protein [Akkermansiaceae bacterium]MDB4526712.1 PQQ-binding-like beta-propeller repeat protein [bacterium]MDA9831267.1 PQQ-binding-like beta-propeller repeat protein [Akkermansiaceae bacterium]MDB4370214.1 PQQ-binding-like beta-propeller repeat protein [Akkermansiaceae bacterium]MDB4384003.1 PQQ-binding-like beta-propeller repeat protein [Akkermansiaceae bacterium]
MKLKCSSLAASSMLLFFSGFPTASGRTWTDAKTGRALEGDFVEVNDGKVSVKRSNGKVVKIDLKLLSKADQDFVASQGKAGGGTGWPTFRGASRTDHSPDQGLLKEWPEGGPKLLWQYSDCGKGYSGPAIVDGKVYYTGSFDGQAKIICLNEKDGKELWTADLGKDPEKGYSTGWGSGPRGTPTVSDGVVYAISANGSLAAVDATDGKKMWSKELVGDFGGKVPQWGYSESPLVDGDWLIVTPGGKDGAIAALDKKTGKTIWRSKGLTDGAEYSSVIIAEVNGKKQYVQLFMKTLAGVDAETGKLLWTSKWPKGRTAVIPTPIYQDGKVYMTSGYGAGCKLVDITGAEAKDVWENKEMKNHHGGVVLVDGYLYGFSDGRGLICQDFKTGERKWNESGNGIQKGAVHYADGMLYCVDESEGSVFLAVATPDGYSEKGRFPIPKETKLREGTNGKVWTHPVVLNGKLYLRDQDLVFCFDVKK